MTHQEILEKAIAKAIENGWNCKLRKYSNIDQAMYIGMGNGNPEYEELIYNKDFAQVLWGEEELKYHELEYPEQQPLQTLKRPLWQYHLQNMVIADDPIEYLGNNL